MLQKLDLILSWKFSGTTVALFLLFPPIPMGLHTSVLSIMALIAILILLFNRNIKHGPLCLLTILLATTILGTFYSIFKGETFSIIQFFRAVTFPLLMLWIIQANISFQLFKELDRLLPLIIFGAISSALMYFMLNSELYNSTLRIPYEDAAYKRLFVYPTYFFLILFFDAIERNSPVHILYALLLGVSGSKAIYLSLVLAYLFFFIKNFSFKNFKYFVCGFGLIGISGYFLGLFERIEDFAKYGDPWRLYEPLAAIARLTDFVRFFIGSGAGVPYWEGQSYIEGNLDVEVSRAIVNSSFDVHNGLMTLALRFGVPLAILFLFVILKAIPKFSGRWILCTIILLNIFLSHGPVQIVEAVGLALGIRYLSYKRLMTSTLAIPQTFSSRGTS